MIGEHVLCVSNSLYSAPEFSGDAHEQVNLQEGALRSEAQAPAGVLEATDPPRHEHGPTACATQRTLCPGMV